MTRDAYDVLGVPRDATLQQITQRYRDLAKTMHPDVAGAANTDAFADLGVAYRILRDPVRRQKYDANRNDDEFTDEAVTREARDEIMSHLGTLVSNPFDLVKSVVIDQMGPRQVSQQVPIDVASNDLGERLLRHLDERHAETVQKRDALARQLSVYDRIARAASPSVERAWLDSFVETRMLGVSAALVKARNSLRTYERAREIVRELNFRFVDDPQIATNNAPLALT